MTCRSGISQVLTGTDFRISFTATADSPVFSNISAPQEIALGVLGGDKLAFKFAGTFAGDPNFVVVSPSSGIAPARVGVALNPNVVPYLAPGGYTLNLQFAAPGQSCPPCAGASVILNLNSPPPPSISSVVGAATLQPGVAPGELVTITGVHLSTPPITGQFDSAGLYPTSLGNTTVTFNGIPAALLYVSTTQINAQAPYGLTGQNTANIVIKHNLQLSPAFPVPILETSPGIFTVTQGGNGPGAVLNAGTPNPSIVTGNSSDSPAPKGSAISIFATGSGLWSRAFQDGSIFLTPLAPPVVPTALVSLTIGGQPARILYAGAAPYLISGILQVNAIVPDNIGSGPQPLLLTIGQNSNAPQQVTVAVQ